MLKRRAFLLLCFVLILSGAAREFSAASPVYQATFTVNSTADTGDATPGNGTCDATGGGCTLRAAVEEANALAGNDTINLPAGNYLLGSPLNIIENVTIIGTGGPVIDGQNGSRIFDLTGTVTFEIRDTILQNGDAGLSEGGAIRSTSPGSSVILQNMTIQNSTAAQGGAIFVFDGSLEITGSTITANNATGRGGAIVFEDDAATAGVVNIAISTTEISDNTADNAAGINITLENDSTGSFTGMQLQNNDSTAAQGGGVITNNSTTTVLYSNSTIEGNDAGTNIGGLFITSVNLENMTIQANTAVNRTGGLETAGTVQITGSTISGNTAAGTDPVDKGGGGIYNTGDLTITTTTIANNEATDGDGAGMYNQGGSFNITASTFSGNTATNGNGGGIYNPLGGANKVVLNSTFSGNTVTGSGAGIYHADGGFINLDFITVFGNIPGGGIFNGAGSTAMVTNSIVSQNGAIRDCEGTGTYLGSNNLAGGGMCNAAADVTFLGPLADNGGPTRTHEPQPGSNAIDLITPCAFPPTDQRGVPRPIPPAGACDAGAVEVLAGIDLSLTKTDTPDPVNAGAALTYTLSVENLAAATSNATAIVLTDTLPVEVTFGSATATNGGICTHNGTNPGGTVTCNWAGPLAPGAAPFSATINVTVDAAAAGVITNTASVAAAETDPVPANNTATQDTTVTPASFADMSITKTDNPDPVLAGGTLDYTVTVTNANTSTVNATTIQLIDTVPAQLTIVGTTPSGTGTCNTVGNTVTCDWAGPLAPGATESVVINTTVDGAAQGTITNNATVTAAENDPNPNDNTVAEDTLVNQPGTANLEITKTDSADPVIAGNALTYTLTVTNLATSAANATNVVVTDNLPAGVTFQNVTPGGPTCTEAAGVVACTFATIAIGASETITIDVNVNPATTGTITNNATVTANEPDPVVANNTVVENTLVQQPVADVSVTKTDNIDPIVAGNALTYTLTVTNAAAPTSNVPATNVVVTDTLPAGVTFQSVTPGGPTCTEAAGVVTCTFATIAVGASETITIVVDVDPATAGDITNTATAAANETDPTPANNTDTETTTVQAPVADVSVTKTDNPDPVAPGSPLTYTLTVTNAATSTVPATNVQVEDTLPAGVTFQSSNPTNPTCTEAAGIVTCTFANLAIGASETITINVNVDPATNGTITNTATVTANETDPTPANNTAMQDTLVIVAAADLQLIKTDNPDPVVAGGNLVYTITVQNLPASTVPATNVQVTDTLPAGVNFISVTSAPTGAACSQAAGVITCNFAAIAVGAAETITVTVATTAAGPLSNTASVTTTAPDPDNTNDSDTEDTTVVDPATTADISVTKQVDAPNTFETDTITYTITVRNNGPAAATDLRLTDTFPPELTYGTVTAPPGTVYDTGTGVWNIGALPVNNTRVLTIQATVNAATAGSDITNQIDVTSIGAGLSDPVPGNNTASVDVHVTRPLNVTKAGFDVNGGALRVGDTVAWIVCALNPDTVPATNVVIRDTLDGNAFTAPTTLNVGTRATCPAALPVTGLTSIPNLPAGNLNLVAPIPGAVNPGEVGVLYFETTVKDPGTSNRPNGLAYALTGGLALLGIFYARKRRTAVLLLLIFTLLLAVSPTYAQEGTSTEEADEPPPLPFMTPTVEEPPSDVATETPTASYTPVEPPTSTAAVETATPIPEETLVPSSTPGITGTPVYTEPTPDAEGWMVYEMGDPRMTLTGSWEVMNAVSVSGGSYLYTEEVGATLVADFAGESLRLDYLRSQNFGIFEVYIDDQLVATIDGYSEESSVTTSEVIEVQPGLHRLRIVNTGLSNTDADGTVLGLDTLELQGVLLEPIAATPTLPVVVEITPTGAPTETATLPAVEASATPTQEVIEPTATRDDTPIDDTEPLEDGWRRYEMSHPDIQLLGNWDSADSEFVSGGSYAYSQQADAAVELVFEGAAVRFDYLQYWNFGIFEVYLDGTLILSIDGYSPDSRLGTSAEFALEPGTHTLRIQNTGNANAVSEGVVIALDAIDVKNITAETPEATATPEPVEEGWTRYEMNAPSMEFEGEWQTIDSEFVSGGSYIYAEEEDAAVSFEFTGDSVRVNYLKFYNFGIFEVLIDDEVVATVDAFSPESQGEAAGNFDVEPGRHVLRIINTGRSNAESAGIGVAIDSIDVHEIELPTLTPTPEAAASITGKVWVDADRNGEISDGDKPAAGLTLTLYADDGDVLFDAEVDTLTATVTVEDGSYEFADLTPGVYWLDAPDSNNPDWEALMVVAPAEVDILEPVQEIPDGEGQISGRVFNDNNADREWSGAGESGIRNVEVLLYLDDGDEEFDPETDTLLDSVEAASDGSYAFDKLPVGVYWVWLDETTLPENYMDTVATGNHGIQNPKLLTITEETPEAAIVPFSEDELTRPENTDFAYALDTDGDTSPDSIEGSGDRDNDGIPNYLDAFDPSGVIYSVDAAGNSNALANVQVRLVWDNGGALTLADTVQPNPQTTSVNGGYRFDIVPGTANGLQATPRTFILEILTLPSPLYTFPSVAFPPQGTTFDATPTAGSGQIVNFSNPPNAAQSHLFYMRFQIQQGDDPVVNNHIAVDVAPLPPADLNLTNRGSATRNDNPTVSESPLVTLLLNTNLGMTFTPNNSSTRSAGATFTYTHTFTNTSTTQSDRVVFSLSQNTQSPAWTRQIRILRGATLLATVNAGASSAPITVAAGESLTVEHVITIPIGTTHGTIDTSTITATSQENTQLSRTVTDVTRVESGCIQGTLFHDVNNNGIREANETVFPNVRMLLTDNNNNPVGQPVTTDANGVYRFSGLPAGIYNVRIDATSIPGGVPVFLNPTTGTAQINVAVGGNCVVGNFSLALVDPAITKIGSVSQARPGETVTFTINLTNPSPTAITNVTVVDPLNGLLVFNSATSTQGTSTFNSTNNTVTFNLGTVAGNATVTMTVNVTVSSLATPGTVINNAATLNYAEGPAETSPQATITIPSAATATPTATATTTGSSGGTQNQAAQSSGGAAGGTGGTGGGADTLPQTGYRPLPANTSLLFGFELDALSAMEITLMLLALVILLVCIVWGVAQWLAEHRSDKLARWLPNRPTPQFIRAVVVIAVVSSIVLSMVFATNLIQKPEQKQPEQQQAENLPEVADVSEFADIEPQTALPIQWTEGGFEFAPPEIPASRIIIPRLGVDSSLVDAPMVGTTWDVSEIYDEVAHLDGTAHPGTMGNAVLAGHIQHQKGLGPFRNLNQLSKGDLIIAQGEDVEYTYIITDIMEVDPHAIEVTYPSNQPLLTLISCTRWDNETWSYKGRLVVRAQFKSWRHTDQEKPAAGSWRRYEVDGRDIHLDADNGWAKVDSIFTSGGSYVYTRDEDAEITLNFTGEKVRIHYLYFWEFGKFDVYIDDEKVATIDAYNPMSLVGSSDIYFLEPGRHTLKIVNTGERNESAKGTVIALDAIDVYRADEE